jgi:pyruvate dehydrogenase E2 component (dihydrolipoamide acetyltransferase)
MPRVFMPKLTHDMEVGVLLEWHKQEGDEVRKGEPLFAVETDKATVDVEAGESGVLRGLRFAPGDEVPVGEVVGWIAAPGEKTPPGADTERDPVAPSRGPVTPSRDPVAPSPRASGRIVASPLAKRLAKEHGVDLGQLQGRGPHGRVTKADVEAYLAQREVPAIPTAPPGEVPYDVVPLSRLRRTTGERMLTSVRTAPHFDLEVEVDMGEACRWRARYAEGTRPEPVEGAGQKVSYTALLVQVVARALREHAQLNGAFIDGELRVYREVNVGVAMATAEGLMVPVVHRADELHLRQIQEAITRLREKAQSETRHKRQPFAPDDVRGGTFTVSNLGMYGIDAFRAIINPPEAAILAVGRIVERPVGVDGQIVLRPIVRLVLSVDHRAVDGAQAASFLATVRRYLENPYLLL